MKDCEIIPTPIITDTDKWVILLLSLQNESLYWAAVRGNVESTKKCISDGANVNYQDEVSYDDVYQIDGSVVNEVFFT